MRFVALCRSRPVLPWQIEFIPSFHQERNQSGVQFQLCNPGARFSGVWIHGLAPDANWRARLAAIRMKRNLLSIPSGISIQLSLQRIVQEALVGAIGSAICIVVHLLNYL